METLKSDEILGFLTSLTEGKKQATKRNRYATLSSLFNFSGNFTDAPIKNPCTSPIVKKMFRAPKLVNFKIPEKEAVDEIIFRTMDARNRIMLELMARAGMRIGAVLKLLPGDIDGQRVLLQGPKSGREGEIVYLPKKLADRLYQYTLHQEIQLSQRIFPISYVAAWYIVRKAGELIGIKLSPHDLRRHAATYASRSGTPIEIVSKVLLRHANLSTTQRYLGRRGSG